MAEIKPLCAWRFNQKLSKEIDNLTSPLFDVVSERQREKLYQNNYNSIHLSVPKGDDAHDQAAKMLQKWKDNGVILQDDLPGIYVYYQYFSIRGNQKRFCRKGFICNIRAYDWEENIILRHENTIPKSVNDRVDLLEKTQLNVSPTHGLYTDTSFELEKYMDESMLNPIYETEDYQGVRDVLSVIHDAEVIKKFIAVLENKQIILADGHHRYESSLINRKRQAAKDPSHTGEEGYNFHMMFLTNTESDDLRILPTHRLMVDLEDFDEEVIVSELTKDFVIKSVDTPHNLNEIIQGKLHTFGLLFRENAYQIQLKTESLAKNPWNFPDHILNLDLTVLHYFIIDKVLGIPGWKQRSSPHIQFDRSFADCLSLVIQNEAQMAIITQDISIDTVKEVCYSGYTMPQKSTYFYPKVICGFLFSSILENEFALSPYSRF